MNRTLTVGAAQMGPIASDESRSRAVARMVDLMRQASSQQVDLVVFPELALTTFFPRWYMPDQNEVDAFFERQMPGPETRPLFDTARELEIGFYLGYAELAYEQGRTRRYNTSILVDACGTIVGKYRKCHLPGHSEHEPWRPFQHLEQRYFEPGDLGFKTWSAFDGCMGMALCNDRRWPETYRLLGLQGAELMMLGYNTPVHYPPVPEHDHLQGFHNHLCMQAGAYQNGLWVVAVAKAGNEEGCELLGESCIIAPTGEIVAMTSGQDDELITYECDLNRTREIREHIFNFKRYRRPELYSLITQFDQAAS